MKHLPPALCCLLILATAALADGVGPLRKMTEAEASACRSLRSTIQSALPKAPKGYTLDFQETGERDEGMIPEAIKPGGMLHIFYQATYTLDRSLRGVREQSAWMDKAKGTPAQQARLAALDAKDAELHKARDHTMDREEKNRLRAQIKAVNAEADSLRSAIMAQYQAWVASGGVAETSQSVEESLPPEEILIRIAINTEMSILEKAVPYQIEGAASAFEQSGECSNNDGYCVTVLLGAFQKTDRISERWRYRPRDLDLGVPTKARTLALTIGGPKDKPESVRQFLRETDWAKLKSLVP